MSTNAAKTIQSKQRLDALACQECFDIKSYHSENGIFASKAWKADCYRQLQTYSYSGVGKQHQHGVAEQNIKTIASWARASMLHSTLH